MHSGMRVGFPQRLYRQSTLYTTLSPCPLCAGAVLLFRIPRVVIGENRTFVGNEEALREAGVQLDVVNDPECIALMEGFIRRHPELWSEDIGEEPPEACGAQP